ncbi:MAG: ferrochelatase, partial [Deferribacterales bacterium]
MSKDFLYVMYMGGPDSIDSIEPFLYNLFTDRDIIDFGIGDLPQKILARLISKRRAKKVRKEYEKLGGASPQLPILNSLLNKVSAKYKLTTDKELIYAVGMCYYHPFIKDTVKKIYSEKFDRISVMTMYPQYSYTTSGSCFTRFYENIKIKPPYSSFKVIPHWHLNQKYNDCIITNIRRKTEEMNKNIHDIHI